MSEWKQKFWKKNTKLSTISHELGESILIALCIRIAAYTQVEKLTEPWELENEEYLKTGTYDTFETLEPKQEVVVIL